MKITKRLLPPAIALLLGALCPAATQPDTGPTATDWPSIANEAAADKVDAAWMKTFQKRCEASGVTAVQAAGILTPVRAVARDGLPVEALQSKIEEGLVKKVPADKLAAVIQQRAEATIQAARMVTDAGYERGSEPWRKLIAAASAAIEGGLTGEDIQPALQRGAGHRPGQLQATLEGGETLARAGYKRELVQTMMIDCMDRDLRRSEIMRIVRIAEQKCRTDSAPHEFRRTLWGDSAVRASVGGSPSGQKQMGPDSSPGAPGSGQGSRGPSASQSGGGSQNNGQPNSGGPGSGSGSQGGNPAGDGPGNGQPGNNQPGNNQPQRRP